ncbi:ATR-interacting protein-like [Glandiceps talaboti]
MNPLFSGPSTKRSTFYNSSSGRSASSSKQSNVDLGMGQSGQIRSSKGLSEAMEKGVLPAPNKKPRISEPDPFDEFPDEEFTAGDLEAMEIMASQAMSQQENGTRKTKTSNTATTGDSSSTSASGSGYNFKPVKNKVSSTASSTVTTDMQGHNQQQKQSNVNYISQGKIQQQTVTGTVKQTSMSTSTTGRKGSHSTSTTTSSRYPLVQSNVNIPSNSFDTHSKEAKTAQESKPLASHQSGQFQKKSGGTAGSVLTPPVGSLARDSPTLPNSQEGRISPSFMQQELDRLKNECAKYKKELSSLHEERYKKDGEIRMLRENLHKTSTDLNKAQMDKINLTEEQKREKSKKEKELWTEVENLKTQLQFKEMEIVEIQNRYKNLERRVETSSSTSVTTTPKNSPQLFKGLPPQIRANTTSPVKMKDGFPTRQSFLANNQQGTPTKSPRGKSRPKYSPRQKRGPTSPGQASSPMRKSSGSYSLDSRQPKLQPVCKLQSSTKKGVCSSAQLVNKLLNITEHQAYNTESSTRQGLITLLQVPTMQSDQHAQVDKDYGTTGLKTNRSPSVPSGECWSPLRITSDENHSKAIQTLSQLLTVLPTTSTNSANVTSTTRHASCCSNNASSLGLLPVIQDHLVKYIDMLHTVAEPSVPSTFSGSTASRSVDNNSMESATSSKSQESEIWAFVQTEKATLNSLVILQRLICHSCCARTALLKGSPDNVVESMSITSGQPGRHRIHGDGDASMMEIDPSAPLIPDTAPTQRQAKRRHTSTKKSKSAVSHCQLHNIPVNGILTKVLRIASIHNMYGQSTAMVQATLQVLLSLAKNSEQSMLDRLQPLLTDGTIQNCLSPDNLYSTVSTAIDILNYIVCNKTIVLSLCNQSESCTLSRLYHLCDSGVDNLSDSQWTQLQFKILQFFATLFSCHHSTVTLLVESDCDCSVEVVKALVLMLYKEYIVYSQLNPEKQIDSPSLKVLRHGILLLHYLCVYDRLFISHRVDVEHSYVKLISAMSALYKELTDITDHEATVIQELWDFDQPDEMWSPDGEEEDDAPMETE